MPPSSVVGTGNSIVVFQAIGFNPVLGFHSVATGGANTPIGIISVSLVPRLGPFFVEGGYTDI